MINIIGLLAIYVGLALFSVLYPSGLCLHHNGSRRVLNKSMNRGLLLLSVIICANAYALDCLARGVLATLIVVLPR